MTNKQKSILFFLIGICIVLISALCDSLLVTLACTITNAFIGYLCMHYWQLNKKGA